MHLWPSARLRDSFKIEYLKKLEWNLNLMKKTQSQTSTSSKLLDGNSNSAEEEKSPNSNGTLFICRELLMILSCCYCCFCCGACVDGEETDSP